MKVGNARLGISIAEGAGIGAAFGAATHRMGVWLAFGIAAGVLLGMFVPSGRTD